MVDPDIVVGHHLLSPDLPQLYERAPGSLKSRLSRLKRCLPQRRMGGGKAAGKPGARDVTVGRLVCDTMLQARDLLRSRVTAAGNGFNDVRVVFPRQHLTSPPLPPISSWKKTATGFLSCASSPPTSWRQPIGTHQAYGMPPLILCAQHVLRFA